MHAELLKDPVQHGLDGRKHILLSDERHFEIELVELAGRTVGTRVLVAKTRGNLKIAVETGAHDELFELLRRLWEGVELARVNPTRNQEIPSPFRGTRGEDRCLKFGKPLLDHAPPDAGDNLGPQHDVAVHLLAPEIEETIAKPDILGIFLPTEHRHRQFRSDGLNRQLADSQLDMAGRDRFVDRVLAALDHVTGHRDNALRA